MLCLVEGSLFRLRTRRSMMDHAYCRIVNIQQIGEIEWNLEADDAQVSFDLDVVVVGVGRKGVFDRILWKADRSPITFVP